MKWLFGFLAIHLSMGVMGCVLTNQSPTGDDASSVDAGAVDGAAAGSDSNFSPPDGSRMDVSHRDDARSPDATRDSGVARHDATLDTGHPDASAGADRPTMCGVTPVGRVALPADDSRHNENNEWWYWTGHLKSQSGRWFGFEEVFFRQKMPGGGAATMAHFAVTDISGQRFHYRAKMAFTDYTVVPNAFNFELDGLTAVGGNGSDTLHGDVDDIVLDLTANAIKAPVLQHGVGYTDYTFGGYTYYYSRERMAASGTLKIGGETLQVTGTTWFDHQWGNIMTAIGRGWDWFAIQLDDNREIMLFVVRDNGTDVLVGGTYTDADCVTTEIAPDAFSVTPLGQWDSLDGKCTYPMGWTVVTQGLTLTVTPVLENQELPESMPRYWEGAATVSGDATGRAYIELTGYCVL
jgi:predicted secreted hydrolase